jgi:hypothetical protein
MAVAGPAWAAVLARALPVQACAVATHKPQLPVRTMCAYVAALTQPTMRASLATSTSRSADRPRVMSVGATWRAAATISVSVRDGAG